MTLERIDPEKLTPASRRALRRILTGFTVLVLFLVVAAGTVIQQANHASTCAARRFSWTFAHDISVRLNTPLPLAGYTGEVLRARQEGNTQRRANQRVLLSTLGKRPSC